MNVFIIGASGYIGRAVATRALNAGHSLTALVRSKAAAARLPPGDVRVVAGSVEDLQALQKGLETADAAIYLATGRCLRPPERWPLPTSSLL